MRSLELLEEHPGQAVRRGSGGKSGYDQYEIDNTHENLLKAKCIMVVREDLSSTATQSRQMLQYLKELRRT